jgi:hypothetical protein
VNRRALGFVEGRMRVASVLCVLLVGCGSADAPKSGEPIDSSVALDSVAEETAAIDSAADSSALPDAVVPDTTAIDSAAADTAIEDTGPLGILCSRTTSGFWCGEEQTCCWNDEFGSGVCKGVFSVCASGSVRINCAGSRDCAAGKICCGTFLNAGRLMNASCATSCPAATDTTYSREVCSWAIPTAGECPAGKKCLGGDRPFGFCM